MHSQLRFSLCFIATLAAACSGTNEGTEVTQPDIGDARDAGVLVDSGRADGGRSDSGRPVVDSGINDAEGPNTGPDADGNSPPDADNKTYTVGAASYAFTLTGSDPDGDSLTFSVTVAPASGSLSGTPPNLTYTRAQDFVGVDSLQFIANDGHEDSIPATITFDVVDLNEAPVVTITDPTPGSLFGLGEPVTLGATAIDAEDGDLGSQVQWTSSVDGVLGTGAMLSVTTLSSGTHDISAEVADSAGATGTATANLEVALTALFPTTRFGTTADERRGSIAVASDFSIYLGGETFGDVDGTNMGERDFYITKLDGAGTPLWSRQLGSAVYDSLRGLALGPNDDVALTGHVSGAVGTAPFAGVVDCLLVRYDAMGVERFRNVFGTSDEDLCIGVATDGDDTYIAGRTQGDLYEVSASGPGEDAIVAKYSATGALLWGKHFSNPAANAIYEDVAVDTAGNVLAAGTTRGDLFSPSAGGNDVIISKQLGTDGSVVWTRQLGSPAVDYESAMALDGDEAIIAFGTDGIFEAGASMPVSTDLGLVRFDTSGTELWRTQYTIDLEVRVTNMVVASDGTIFVAGYGGNAGTQKGAFIFAFDSAGTHLWTDVFGTSTRQQAHGVAMRDREVLVSGTSDRSVDGVPGPGGRDAFVLAFDPANP